MNRSRRQPAASASSPVAVRSLGQTVRCARTPAKGHSLRIAAVQQHAAVQVLSNHVVLGAWDAAALIADIQGAGPGGLALPTLGGARLLLTTDGLSIFILPEGSSAVTAPAVV